MINDVALWFARNSKDEIVTINEIKHYHEDKYTCPLCNSEVIPKAIRDDAKVTEHFAHIDKSKCTAESMIHWWYKNKFLQNGDRFIITTDKTHEYICKDILIEKTYHTEYGDYKPDVTIITESGDTIYFEYAFTNNKKVKVYLDKWLELGNVVVEVNLKTLLQANYGKDTYKFNALFYNGKCFNTNKRDLYYKTIGEYKERVYADKSVDIKKKQEIEKLDYIWELISKYKLMKISKNELLSKLYDYDCIFNKVILDILVRARCTEIIDDLFNEFKRQILNEIKLYNDVDYPNIYDHLRVNYRYHTRYNDPMIEIEHYNILEKCWYVSNSASSYYKTKQELIDYILSGFKDNKRALELEKEKVENEKKLNHIKELVENSDYIKYLKELFNDKTVYNLNLHFNSWQDKFELENKLKVNLNYNYSNYCIMNEDISIDVNNFNIDDFINEIKENIQNTLLNIKPFTLNQASILSDIANQLNDYYKSTWLNIKFNDDKLVCPNEYKLEFIYEFKREGKSKHNRPYLYSSDQRKTYYIKDNKIKEYNQLICNYSNVSEIKSKMVAIVSQIVRVLKSEEKIIDIRR